MLTFLHAADIHLDSPLRGLSYYDGAPPIEEIGGATRQALDNKEYTIVLIFIACCCITGLFLTIPVVYPQ
jgi:hypothetical protein